MMKQRPLNRHTKSLLILPFLILLLLPFAMVPTAAADQVTWNLSGVTLAYNWQSVFETPTACGTLSGWFTYDALSQSFGNWSISAAINPLYAPAGLTNPFIFNPSNSVASFYLAAPVNNLFIKDTATGPYGSLHSMGLSLLGNLSLPIATTLYSYPDPDGSHYIAGFVTPSNVFSYLNYHVAPGGQLTPSVPEPSTLFLIGAGLVGLAGFRRKVKN